MEDRGSGDLIKKEDLPEKIKGITKIILDKVGEYNDLVEKVDHLDQQSRIYMGFYPEPYQYNKPLPLYDENAVNAVLRTNDYQKMLKFSSQIGVGIWKLKSEIASLEREVKRLQDIEHLRWQARVEEMERAKKEREEKERLKREKDNKRVAIEMLICVIVAIALAVISGISSVRSGESWWCGLIVGVFAFIFGIFIVGEIEENIK